MREIKFRAWDGSGKYVAGSDGLIYSTDFNHTGKTKALKGWLDKYGYPTVLMNIDGKRVCRKAHTLVALAFIGERPTLKHQVNHKNGIRNDNRPENLEYLTSRENTIDGWNRGRKHSEKQLQILSKNFTGEKNPKAKLNKDQVFEIRRLRMAGQDLLTISEKFGVSRAQVSAICNKNFWK